MCFQVGGLHGDDAIIRCMTLVEAIAREFFPVGEDLFSAGEEPDKIRNAVKKLSFLVVQDSRLTATAKLAHVVLPATHFGEKEGTYTNRRGRVQKVNAAVIPPDGVLQDAEIFVRLLDGAGEKAPYATPAAVFEAIAQEVAAYRGLDYGAIGADGVDAGSDGAGSP